MEKSMSRKLSCMTAVVLAALLPASALAAPPKAKMSTPILSQEGATGDTIDVGVTGGTPTGAPAGFSLQWMLADGFTAWPSSDSTSLCKASFSGNANGYNYSLDPGEKVTVTIGELLLDAGASTNCNDMLVCGTTYVFRAFAHANSSFQRSLWTDDAYYSTASCGGSTCRNPSTLLGNCTNTRGFWSTHGPIPQGNNVNAWLADGLMLGSNFYGELELLAILNSPVGGNGLVSLAQQLIAAKLNLAGGADDSAISSTIADADALIGSLMVGIDSLSPSVTGALTAALDAYNNGVTGPGHCAGWCQ